MHWLFDTSMGPPGLAGNWPSWLTALFHLANMVTAIDCLAVPLVVMGLWSFRRDGLRAWELWRILAFFPALAASKGCRVIELWGPPYHLTTILDLVCAAMTTYSVYHLPRVFKEILLLPSREQIHALNNQLNGVLLEKQVEQLELGEKYSRLRKRVDRLEDSLGSVAWTAEARKAIQEVRDLLKDSRLEMDSGEVQRGIH